MKNACLALVLGSLWVASGSAATVPFETQIRLVQSAIDRASERGRLEEVRALRLQLARQATARGYYFEAARQYELLLAARPARKERVNLFTELGKMREATGDYMSAMSSYEDALHDDPRAWDPRLALARANAHVGFYDRAQHHYQICLERRPGSAEVIGELADMYRKRGFLTDAIATYQKAIALKPTAASFVGLSETYRLRGDDAEAARVLQAGQQSGVPGDYEAALGNLARHQGRISEAVTHWEKALAQEPTRMELKLSLAWAYAILGRRKDSERLYDELETQFPQSSLVCLMHGWSLMKTGESRLARKELEKVRAMSPTDLVKHYNKALLQELKP